MRTYFVIAAILIAGTSGQESFKCPDDFGFYPHHISCDKYWKCDNNAAELKTCGNGLAFDASDSKFLTENCDYLHNVDCGERTQLEPPISTPHCTRLYGIYADEKKCDVFWNCWNGEASRYQCSPGLAYDREARVCMWADQVPECRNEGTDCLNLANCLINSLKLESFLSTVQHNDKNTPSSSHRVHVLTSGFFSVLLYSEDYYGDLDLKSIRKSELLAGIQSEHKKSNQTPLKPRPSTGGPARPSSPLQE
ncbi:protein obstructor-E [Formica exsecta]|uniref:protein obstructor-E n=1 Tax=Formica exsecta TaxID=72781 RepID=UPI00114267B4|nr:protein obstructor-E [Formica exsecta]